MAITIPQHKYSVTASSLTGSITFDSTPTDGNLIVAFGHYHYFQTGNALSVTTPATGFSSVDSFNPSQFVWFGNAFVDTFAAAQGDTVTLTKSGTATNAFNVFCLELAGASAFDVASNAQGTGTSLAVSATSAVASNNSLAILLVSRVTTSATPNTPSYTKTGTAAGSWSELVKAQRTSAPLFEYYVATMTVNAGETVGCTFGNMPASTNLCGQILVFTPVTNTAPTITAPASKRIVSGKANTIANVSVADADDDALTVEIQCTSGTLSVATADATSSGITITSGNGTNDLILDGTVAQFTSLFAQGAGQGVKYTQSGLVDDTITWDVDDGTASGIQDSTTVTLWEAHIYGNTIADVRAVAESVGLLHDTVEAVTVTALAEDSGGRTDTATSVVTVSASSGGEAFSGASHTKLSHTVGLHL